VPRAEVDDFKPVRFLAVCKNREAVVAPDLVLGGLFRILDFRLEIRPAIASRYSGFGADTETPLGRDCSISGDCPTFR
jgi:hypothetical protein